MTKVVHLTSVHSALDIRIFQKECRTLSKAGFEVVLVAPHNSDQVVDGVQIRSVKRSLGRLRRMTVTAWQVFQKGLREKGDIYHLHDPELLPWGQLLRLMGKPVVYDMHENVPKDISTKQWMSPTVRLAVAYVFRKIERLCLIGLGVVYAETSYARDYPWVRHCTEVLNMPLLTDLLRIDGEKFPVFTVGYLGSVAPERGTLVTLEALKILRARGYEVNWCCMGPLSSNHRTELEHLSAEAGLGTNVTIAGQVVPQVGWTNLRKCHVGLAVLQPLPNFVESYPTKLFEYMALGLPVVVSNFALYRRIVHDANCGFCIDPDRPEDLADAIQSIIDHPAVSARMGENGRDAVQANYSWDNEARKLLDYYHQTLAAHS